MVKLPQILALFALAVCACGEGATKLVAPLDAFTFPTGLRLHALPDGRRALVVISSNADLRYDAQEGGSVLVVDPDASSGETLSVLGSLRIASLGGPPAVVSSRAEPGSAGATCPGWTGGDELLVTSRTANAVYRLGFGDDGSLTCGERCRVPFTEQNLLDPFDIAVVCRVVDGAFSAQAYVTHLSAPTGAGWLSKMDLLTPDLASQTLNFTTTATQNVAWDPARERLYVSSRTTAKLLNYAPIRWLDVAFPSALFGAFDVNAALRGSDTRGIALAAPQAGTGFLTRAYIAVRVFDQDLALTYGARTSDVAGALVIVNVGDGPDGRPLGEVQRIIPVGIGPSEVAVLPGRPAGQELVAVTSDEGSVALFDARHGSVVRVLALATADTVAPGPFQPLEVEDPAASPGPRDADAYHAGERLFGSKPFALASDLLPDGKIRVFVSSFDRGFVVELRIDPDQPSSAQVVKRFGRRQPKS